MKKPKVNSNNLLICHYSKHKKAMSKKGRRTMKMIKKVLNKIAYIFICINQDIKMRYQIQKEVEDDVLQFKYK